jgi:6-phosphogluconolactonase (cycloisomerase 2 family)
VTIDLSGQFVYVTNKGSNSVSQFNIGTMGRLTPNSPTTAIAQKSPYSLAISHGTIPIAAVAKYAYVTNRGTSRTISQYTIGANGALTSMNPATVAAGEFPTGVAIKGGYQ